MMMRLDKYLSEAGLASRREIKSIIREGRVSVDGQIVRIPETKISNDAADITVDGTPVKLRGRVVLMLHKPAGYVTAVSDKHDATVMELLPPEFKDLFPVGRLDKDTEGLLLFTNDGDLGHRLTAPKHQIEKEYYAETEGIVDEADVAAFADGLVLRDGTRCLPALLRPAGNSCYVVLREGKYHQVRRMLASRGKPVTYLRRIREGCITLGDLKTGQWRLLTDEEIGNLL